MTYPHPRPISTYMLGTTSAVSNEVFWEPINDDTPRGVKLQLLGKGGVAIYASWDGKNKFFTHWAPLPKLRPLCTAPSQV